MAANVYGKICLNLGKVLFSFYFICYILLTLFRGICFTCKFILFFSISGIASLITCYNLQLKNIFKKS